MSIYSQPDFYKFSEDSTWAVQNIIDCLSKEKISPTSLIDIGAGSGVIGIEVSQKLLSIKDLSFVEKETDFIPHLKKNAKLLAKNISIQVYHQDFLEIDIDQSFDLVVSNPPYYDPTKSRLSKDPKRRACRFMTEDHLKKWIERLNALKSRNGQGFYLLPTERQTNDDLCLKVKDGIGLFKI